MSDDLQQKYDPQGDTTADGVTSRVRYFDGQFLKDQDFVDDQKYHIDRQRRVNRLLQISGICEGLTLEVKGGNKVYVNPGTALDQQGRLLVLTEAQEVLDLNQDATQTVYITYQIQADAVTQSGNEIVPETHKNAEANRVVLTGIKGATRLNETPLVTAQRTEFSVTLGKVAVQNGNITVIDSEEREYSGVYLPSGEDGKEGPSLRSGGDKNSKLAMLNGSLTVTGVLSVGETLFTSQEGRVGIGIQPGVAETLKVKDNTTIVSSAQPTLELRVSQQNSSHGRHSYIVSRANSENQYATDLGFKVRNAELPYTALEIPDSLTILHNGNVGIGIEDPDVKLQVQGDLTVQGVINTEGLILKQRESHIEKDGALYRYSGQVYLTVDDNFYIRDASGSIAIRINTNDRTIECQGLFLKDGFTSHKNEDGALYKQGGQLYLTVDDNFYVRDTSNSQMFHFNTNNCTLTAHDFNDDYDN